MMEKKPERQMEGRARVVIENITPAVDGGRYAIKRVVGETVAVEADLFADGHDVLSAVLLFRQPGQTDWSEAELRPIVNDRWGAEFRVERLGTGFYTVEAWVDHFKSWEHDTEKKTKAGQDISVELLTGAHLVEDAATRAAGADAEQLRRWATELKTGDTKTRWQLATSTELLALMARYPDRRLATRYPREFSVTVDPVLARFGSWYEIFPRSCPGKRSEHGTFNDVARFLPHVAKMGFDILYLPPIHPIGRAFRKGKNNNPSAAAGEPGSPWGIGAAEGGHKAVLPELGTLEDFRALVKQARALKIEIALDIAYQCSPDHPYVKTHPEWFKMRPDGTIQYAENPPKKYQDIYPINFESENWRELWEELKSVIEFWIDQGVTVFRVDNPHTKALPFWEWMIAQVKAAHPETIFLSEAFTRPKLMYGLAKLGFTQSYNYFPWRNTKAEITAYFRELTQTPVKEFFRPNLWPNTPDILPQYLQYGGRPAFITRLVLAGTLGASYGIYGPAFEQCVREPRAAGSEEYLDSEKYEIKNWDLNAPGNITGLVERLNRIRRENAALQSNEGLRFHAADNEQIIAYSKATPSQDNIVLVVVNLDPHHVQRGWLELPAEELDLPPVGNVQVHDLFTEARYLWQAGKNYVELDPQFSPAHIFRLRRRVRTEKDFDYFL